MSHLKEVMRHSSKVKLLPHQRTQAKGFLALALAREKEFGDALALQVSIKETAIERADF